MKVIHVNRKIVNNYFIHSQFRFPAKEVIMSEKVKNLRESLILAGIDELNTNGINGFSIRRVADKCNVSCAAPYNHFKDKLGLIASIIDYVNDLWAAEQDRILAGCSDNLREQIIEISVGYIRYLMENPQYRSVLLMKDAEFDNLYHKKRGQFGSFTQAFLAQYEQLSGLTPEVWQRKLLTVRSLIFGALFLFDAGEFEYNDENIAHIRFAINREFEIF